MKNIQKISVLRLASVITASIVLSFPGPFSCAPLEKMKYPERLRYERDLSISLRREETVQLVREWMVRKFGFISKESDPLGAEPGYLESTGFTYIDIGCFSLPCEYNIRVQTSDNRVGIHFGSVYITYLDGSRDRLTHRAGWEKLKLVMDAISTDLYNYLSAYGQYSSDRL